jgi:hypothetical protein
MGEQVLPLQMIKTFFWFRYELRLYANATNLALSMRKIYTLESVARRLKQACNYMDRLMATQCIHSIYIRVSRCKADTSNASSLGML